MKKVAAFGELMLRLNPDGYLRLTQASDLHMSFAGGEANAAVSISNFGTDTVFVTKLPDNDLGKMAVRELRKYGVNGDHIAWGGPRIGIYFVEKGASQRPSRVLYDRGGSSIALARRVSLYRNYAGPGRGVPGYLPGRPEGMQETRNYRKLRSQLPWKTMEPERSRRGHGRAYGVCGCMYCK